jgi:hypothetical protein
MGLSYEHITLMGPPEATIVDYLAQSGRHGYISPTMDGITVVYDQSSAMDDSSLLELAADLSQHFNCPALATFIHDSSVMIFYLYEAGQLTDTYNSLPGYFDDSQDDPTPQGGDAARLCAAFEVSDAIAAVQEVLRHHYDLEKGGAMADHWLAEERHTKLASALGLPSFVAYIGYDAIAEGDVDEPDFIPIGL